MKLLVEIRTDGLSDRLGPSEYDHDAIPSTPKGCGVIRYIMMGGSPVRGSDRRAACAGLTSIGNRKENEIAISDLVDKPTGVGYVFSCPQTLAARLGASTPKPGLTQGTRKIMPEAENTHTPSMSGVVAAMRLLSVADGDGETILVSVRRETDEAELLSACHAATVQRQAMELLMSSVAEMDPTDPRHEASYRAAAQLRPAYAERLERICTVPARGARGLLAKATLLSSLVERDEHDRVQGGTLAQVAASLSDDVLVLGWT